MMTDPIADMLTRIRNGALARHDRIELPQSRMKVAVANILKAEGYVADALRKRKQKTASSRSYSSTAATERARSTASAGFRALVAEFTSPTIASPRFWPVSGFQS
jgi:ribosomal protein S8